MGNVNRFPKGLPSFLQLATSGAAPDMLVGSVQAVLDLEKFWRLGGEERLTDVRAVAPSSAIDVFTIPAGEIWLVTRYSVYGNVVAANDGYQLVPWMRYPNSDIDVLGAPRSGQSNAVNITANIYTLAEVVPYLAPGGCTLGYSLTNKLLAGNGTVSANVNFVRLRG